LPFRERVKIGATDGSLLERSLTMKIDQALLDETDLLSDPEACDAIRGIHRAGVLSKVVEDPML
jgi:hypothetical protein